MMKQYKWINFEFELIYTIFFMIYVVVINFPSLLDFGWIYM